MKSNKISHSVVERFKYIKYIIEFMEGLDWKLFIIILFALGCATFLAYNKIDNTIIIAIIGLASNIVTWSITKSKNKNETD